tara:strand:- start:326 stop:820 length:495 start_codon:yes stop_codon:yes gene_type:complete
MNKNDFIKEYGLSRGSIIALHDDNIKLRAENEEIRVKFNEGRDIVCGAKDSMKEMFERIAVLEKENQNCKKVIGKLMKENALNDDKINDLEEQVLEYEKWHGQYEELLSCQEESFGDDVSGLQYYIDALKERIDNYEQENYDLEEKVSSLEGEVEDLESRIMEE